MIEVAERDGKPIYASSDPTELDDLSIYLEEVFPDAQLGRVFRDKSMGTNLLPVDMGEETTKKDFTDLLDLYRRMKA